MFGKLDLTKEIKIPKGIVMMIKSLGFDAKAVEEQVFKMGKDAVSLLNHCDGRLTQLSLQHQVLHEAKDKLLAEVARLHSRFDTLETLIKERLTHGNGSSDPGSNRNSAS